jgi:leucyl-tRNA synthetase
MYGAEKSIAYEAWPEFMEAYLIEETFEYPVSVNGKLRFSLVFPVNETEEIIKNTVLAHEKTQKWTDGKEIVKWIIVPNKIVNIVVK